MLFEEHCNVGMKKQHDNLVKHNTYIGGGLIVYRTRKQTRGVLHQYYLVRASVPLIS
jgi:hypothetical protein